MSVKYDLPSTFSATSKPVTYDSPYSQHPVDNAQQGTLTNGVLVNMFKAPAFGEDQNEPINHVYGSRLQQKQEDMNKRVSTLTSQQQDTKQASTAVASTSTAKASTVQAATSQVTPAATPSTAEAFKYKVKEHFKGIPGLVDSHLVSEAFTSEQSLNIIVIILSIIAICVCGIVFGFIVPSTAKGGDSKLSGGDVF